MTESTMQRAAHADREAAHTDRRAARRGPAVRDAILDVACELFAAEGIRAVSADRVLAAAGFSKVTFYRHFPTKDHLVVAYVTRQYDRVRRGLEQVGDIPVPLETVAALLADEMGRPGFRGCPFINVAVEYPAADHPVRQVVDQFRATFTQAISRWLVTQGVTDPLVAHQVMMLRDGALVAGYLDGHDGGARVAALLDSGLRALISSATPAGQDIPRSRA